MDRYFTDIVTAGAPAGTPCGPMVSARWHGASRAALCAVQAALLIGVLVGGARGETPADRFVATLDERTTIPPDARALIQKAWNECGEDCDGESLLMQGLTLLLPEFRGGLDAYDADDYVGAARIMNALRSDTDPFIATNAGAYEIKALVQGERLIEALEAIERNAADGGVMLSTYSYLAPEIDFLRGYCLLADLHYRKAADALGAFLLQHTDASLRLVVSAQQMYCWNSKRANRKK